MRVVIFCHSLCSDWNHGNAHFLRGIASELRTRGHTVSVYEPRDAWSAVNLERERGAAALDAYRVAYPDLVSHRYDAAGFDVAGPLGNADLVLVHEWNQHELVARIGEHRARHRGYRLFFHDTHHRSVTDPASIARYDLSNYDGVLAFGDVVAEAYRRNRWTARAWTWHEAADTRVFYRRTPTRREGDLVWIGNWGDDERAAELREFLVEPVRDLGLRAALYGVRYPPAALEMLREAGIEYRGWLPNHMVPEVYAAFHLTVHVPRGPYVRSLPGVPTIRVFEALACGIPLVTSPWSDSEQLFSQGADYLRVRDGFEMREALQWLLSDSTAARDFAAHGERTIHARHTCAHRTDELFGILDELEELPPGSRAA